MEILNTRKDCQNEEGLLRTVSPLVDFWILLFAEPSIIICGLGREVPRVDWDNGHLARCEKGLDLARRGVPTRR